jgi:hypothetical protein
MDLKSRGPSPVLGLTLGLLACQDQGVMAPDGLAPQFAVDCDAKPNHFQCVDGDPKVRVELGEDRWLQCR